MGFNSDYFWECLRYGIIYIPNTIKLVFISLLIGFIFGTIIALIRVYKVPVINKVLAAFVTVYQGVPIVVALLVYNLLFMLEFNNLAKFLNLSRTVKDVDNIWVGIFALTLTTICSMSEVIRGALLSIDKGQNEAGYSVGLTKVQTIQRIIVPQMIPVAIPMMINNIVGLIKASSVVMTIGITEITAGAITPGSRTYSFFEGYAAAALIYWAFTVVIEYLAGQLRKHTGKFKRSAYD
jgi:ABC-type amino acid transport system, permease component